MTELGLLNTTPMDMNNYNVDIINNTEHNLLLF